MKWFNIHVPTEDLLSISEGDKAMIDRLSHHLAAKLWEREFPKMRIQRLSQTYGMMFRFFRMRIRHFLSKEKLTDLSEKEKTSTSDTPEILTY